MRICRDLRGFTHSLRLTPVRNPEAARYLAAEDRYENHHNSLDAPAVTLTLRFGDAPTPFRHADEATRDGARVFTALVGLTIAPARLDPLLGFITILAIAAGAGAAGVLNMWYDAD